MRLTSPLETINLYDESRSKYSIKVTEETYSEAVYEGRAIIDQDAVQESKDMAWACAMMKLCQAFFENLRFPLGNVEDNFLMYKLLLRAGACYSYREVYLLVSGR